MEMPKVAMARYSSRPEEADGEGKAEAADEVRPVRPHEDRRPVGADGVEGDDARVEEAGEPPLEVQPHHHDRIDGDDDEEEDEVEEEAGHALPPVVPEKSPVGLT